MRSCKSFSGYCEASVYGSQLANSHAVAPSFLLAFSVDYLLHADMEGRHGLGRDCVGPDPHDVPTELGRPIVFGVERSALGFGEVVEPMLAAVGESVVATHMLGCRPRLRLPIAMREV